MTIPAWLLVLLAIAAVARITVLINDDYLTAGLRARLDGRNRGALGSYAAYFVECPWCVSMWAGAGVGAAVYFEPHRWWVDWPLIALSASYVTGWLAERREP